MNERLLAPFRGVQGVEVEEEVAHREGMQKHASCLATGNGPSFTNQNNEGREMTQYPDRACRRRRERPVVTCHLAAFLGVAICVVANAQEPAVSGLNGKAALIGGAVDSDTTVAAIGSISVPLGKRFGAQIDGAAGEIDSDGFYAIGGHAFWRDPARGLAGVVGTYADKDNDDLWYVGAEGEWYAGSLTAAGELGWQDGDTRDDGAYGRLALRYYFGENLMAEVGGEATDDLQRGHLLVEGQPTSIGVPGLALFATAAGGDQDYVLGGIRYYFGANKSLIKRHREDDPANAAFKAASRVRVEKTSRRGPAPAPVQPPPEEPPPEEPPPEEPPPEEPT